MCAVQSASLNRSPERVIMSWDSPILEAACEWLWQHGADESVSVNLSHVACVTPGRRAGRVLLALLVERAERAGRALIPPDLLVPGQLPARLCRGLPAAGERERLLAWMHALDDIDVALHVSKLLRDSDRSSPQARVALGRRLLHLHDELAAERRSFLDAAQAADDLDAHAEAERWRAVHAIFQIVRRRFGEAGLVDPNEAFDQIMSSPAGKAGISHLVLIGVPQLNEQQRQSAQRLAQSVTALICGDESIGDHFDAFGCVDVPSWSSRTIDLPDEEIIVSETPADQAQAALQMLATEHTDLSVDDVTFGLADEALADALTIAARHAGLDVHTAAGTSLHTAAPFRLLQAFADFLADERFARFAALLRHPDLERHLAGQLGEEASPEAWIPLLDRYFADHLHERIADAWLGDESTRTNLARIWSAVQTLIEPFRAPEQPLVSWCREVLKLLAIVYEGEVESQSLAALLHIRDELQEFASASPSLQPVTAGDDALRLLLAELARTSIPAEVRANQIDMLGWLELLHDPAPVLIVLGMNEGSVPASVSADAFLPDRLRTRLGLADNATRFARDAYLVEAMRQSRSCFRMISGRVDARGEPRQPSRILLACDDATLIARVRRLCSAGDEDQRTRATTLPIGAPPCGEISGFDIPELPADLAMPESMSVTDFRAYLACPYRYALEKLLRLREATDQVRELDALQFGSLAHAVLQQFGETEDARDWADADRIRSLLFDALHTETTRRFGPVPLPAVRLQLARLEQRLESFAQQQAALVAEGWRIRHCEYRLPDETRLEIEDGPPMPVRGTIDRIDVHETLRKTRIVDYKTGDAAASPHVAHHGRRKIPEIASLEWLDLQLPLYGRLVPDKEVVGEIELGYIVLPKTLEETNVIRAEWTDAHLDAALECALDVVRRIRAREFGINPGFASSFDAFARICQTQVFRDDDDASEESNS